MLSEVQGVSLRITSSVRVRTVYHDLYLGGKALVERENVGFDSTKSDLCPSFVKALTAKGRFFTWRIPILISFELEGEAFEPERRNKWDSKSYKDKLPLNIKENPMFQHLGRYPTSVRVFCDPILFFAGLKPLWQYGQQRPAILVDEKAFSWLWYWLTFRLGKYGAPSVDSEPTLKLVEDKANFENNPKPEVFVVHPGSVAAWIKDRRCITRGGSSRPHVKRKLAPGSLSSRDTRAKTSSSMDDPTFLIVSNDDEGLPDVFELKDANAYNLVNRRSRELLQVIKKIRGKCDVMKERETTQGVKCDELRTKCKAAMNDFEKNPTVAGYQVSLSALDSKVASMEAEKARLEAVEVSLRKEVDDVKCDRKEAVSKVISYATLELIHSDELGRLVGKLVSSAIFYGRCAAFEQVADMNEPFYLSKVKGYLPSYKKEHTQASNELTTISFLWFSEFVADPSAPIKVLLSKKPPTLQRHVPSKTQVPLSSSQKATPASAPTSNLMSPPIAVNPSLLKVNEGHHVGDNPASSIEATSLLSFLLAFSLVVSLLSLATILSAIGIMVSEPEKDCVIFNPLQRSANMPSLKCFSSFEPIVRGTPNMHIMYSHANFFACLPFIVVSGFASTHFIECSTAMARNFKPPGASGTIQQSHGVNNGFLYKPPLISLYYGALIMIFLDSLGSSGSKPLIEYGVSTSIVYGVSSSLSNTAYPSQMINTAYPLPSDMAYPVLCPIQLRMTKVIKGEFEKIKDVKVEDVPLTCDASLEVFNDEVIRSSKMDDDLFTYEVEVANILCDSKMDNDSEQEADDDMGNDLSDVAFIKWLG
ncbi:hypothetical protein Tco_0185032 [Tanacetum coccineum]